MSNHLESEAPQTLEGWYALHDAYTVDWPRWYRLKQGERDQAIQAATAWLELADTQDHGHSAAYSLLTQKGDLLFIHYRPQPEDLNHEELALRQTTLFEYLRPAYSFLSVIEIGLYELTAIVLRKLADQSITPESPQYSELFQTEMSKQRTRVETRLFPAIPDKRYLCFYPMSKRRGEQVNWYTLPINERRDLMRGHGRIGHKYHEEVIQAIGGAIGLDDWEWGVSLFADDMLLFKKLIHELRFDPASARYAEFGPFYLGIRLPTAQFSAFLAGNLEQFTQ